MMRTLLLFVLIAATVKAPSGWLGFGVTLHTESRNGRVVRQWLFVREVMPGGPAAKAGVRVQDVVTAVNGKPVVFRDELAMLKHFSTVKSGQQLVLTVTRGDQTKTLRITASTPPRAHGRIWRENLDLAAPKPSP